METISITLDLASMRKVFEEFGYFNVSKEEIETVIGACLTQYVKDGWAREVLLSEIRQLRSNPEAYRKETGLCGSST